MNLRFGFACLGLLLCTAGAIADTAADDRWQFAFSGSHRVRYERLVNQFRPGFGDDDQALQLHTLLDMRAVRGRFSAQLELQDSRNYRNDRDSWLSTININALEPLQASVGIHFDDALRDGASLDVRIGRQTIDLGGRRLVARNRYRNTLQNYTGWRATWRSGRIRLDAFHVLPVLVRPADAEGLLDNAIRIDEEDRDLQLWGVFATLDDIVAGIGLEAYAFGLRERDDPMERATADRDLLTPGLRLFRAPRAGGWDLDLELVRQFGDRRQSADPADTQQLDVDADFVHVSVGYTFAAGWSPRLSVEYDGGSGDRSRADDRYQRFDSLFGPRRAEFNATGIYGLLGRENIRSAGLRLTVVPDERSDAFVSLRANRLDEAADAFARSLVRDPAGLSGRDAGTQVEVRYRRWLRPDRLRLEAGGIRFAAGRFLRTAPASTGAGDPLFFYTDLTWQF